MRENYVNKIAIYSSNVFVSGSYSMTFLLVRNFNYETNSVLILYFAPNLMQMSKFYCSTSFALGLAHEKFDVSNRPGRKKPVK